MRKPQYLRGLFQDRSPSYGQRVLGALLTQGLTDLVLTTNFDDLIEQAADAARSAVTSPSRSRLGVAALGDSGRAGLALSDDDFPLLIKLHGDFRERELKNLDTELRKQDEGLRRAFLDSSRRFGLAVIGYSGRDTSVMSTLAEAVQAPGALPGGLWWLTRDPESVSPSVLDLMRLAAEAGVAARFVKIENFDETLAEIGRQATMDPALRSYVDGLRPEPRVIDAAIPQLDAGSLPVLRMNALPVLRTPPRALQATLHEKLEPIELQRRLREARWRGAVAMSGERVLALGSASKLSEVLDLTASAVEVSIDCQNRDAPTIERALAYESLTRALARRLPAYAMVRQRGHLLRVRPVNVERPDSPQQASARETLQQAYEDPLTGRCPASLGQGPDGDRRGFAEAVRLSIELRFGVLWLLFVPHTWVSPVDREVNGEHIAGDPASAWRKECWVNRRNERWAAIIGAWAQVLAPDDQTVLPVLPAQESPERDIVGGEFVLGRTTAYSRVAR